MSQHTLISSFYLEVNYSCYGPYNRWILFRNWAVINWDILKYGCNPTVESWGDCLSHVVQYSFQVITGWFYALAQANTLPGMTMTYWSFILLHTNTQTDFNNQDHCCILGNYLFEKWFDSILQKSINIQEGPLHKS